MKLNYTYKIYWFENEDGWLESAIENLKEKYEDSNINFDIIPFKNAEGVEKITPDTEIDILLMDYNLSGIQGDKIIKTLRDNNVLCDIIFYSQNADFDEELTERDGVFTTARNNLTRELNKKVDKHKTLIEDVSTLRGNFITSVIDLELKINEIITLYFELKPNKEDFFREEIVETDFFHVGAKLKVAKRIGNEFLKSLEEDLNEADAGQIELLKKKKVKLETTLGIFKGYDRDIMDVRNTLAHSKDEIHADGSALFRHNTKRTEYIVTEAWVREKMRHLVMHSINLDRLLTFIS